MSGPRTPDLDGVVEVEQYFAQIPEWVLRAPIPDRAVRLYGVIQRIGNSSGQRMPGRTTLADQWLHCSKSSVTRAIAELESYGALRVRRDTRPEKGETGRIITTNRYLLVTTDPSLTVVRPAFAGRPPAAYPVGHPRTRRPPVTPNREKDLPPPPTPSEPTRPQPARSLKAAVAAVDQTALETLGDLDELCSRIGVTRRELGLPPTPFRPVNIGRAIAAAIDAGYEPNKIPDALIALASDPATRSPMRLPHDGAWWDVADMQARLERRRTNENARRNEPQRLLRDCPRCDDAGYMQTLAGQRRCDHILLDDDEETTA